MVILNVTLYLMHPFQRIIEDDQIYLGKILNKLNILDAKMQSNILYSWLQIYKYSHNRKEDIKSFV